MCCLTLTLEISKRQLIVFIAYSFCIFCCMASYVVNAFIATCALYVAMCTC